MVDAKRMPWSESDNSSLIEYWDSVGSIVLISMLLDRSQSSVQTQASRLGLPRREESKDRHRRRWTPEDEARLAEVVKTHTLPDGRIGISEVAASMERSIDAIAARMAAEFDDQKAFLARIVIPSVKEIKSKAAERALAANGTARTDAAAQGLAIVDTRKQGRQRPCLSCTKPFWSEGAHNRICNKCKREDSGSEW